MSKNIKNVIIWLIVFLIGYFAVVTLINNDLINDYYLQIVIMIGINIILVVSLNLIIGFTGQLALGHAGFMCIGGYVAAIVTAKLGLPFLFALIVGGLAAAIVGLLIGMPVLKLKGDYLAITTLAFGQIIVNIFNNFNYVGGPRGLVGISKETNFTWVYIITILTIVIIYNIIRSSHGRAMISVREDEIAAEAMGINTFKYKVAAFAIGAFFAGIAGGLYVHFMMYSKPSLFGFQKSVDIVTAVVLGGMGSLSGSILSAAFLICLPEVLRPIQDYRMIIYSASLVILMLFRPQGLMGTKELSLQIFKKPFKKINSDRNGGN